jgi:VIT1/CCC1 family predicted Fe2+/Mn2+ transporter
VVTVRPRAGRRRRRDGHDRIFTASEETKEDPCAHEHFSQRGPWLRAAVLGANDGLVTVGSLLTGISAASVSHRQLILSAVAALVSGVMAEAHAAT